MSGLAGGDGRERRTHRSSDPLTALCRLLDAARKDERLEALAVADDSGCLVAGAGAAFRAGARRLTPRITRENPSMRPIELLMRPPSSSTIMTMSHAGRMS